MNATWKAAAGVILIFILGWFGGALTTLVIARHKALALIQMTQHNPEALAIVLERQTTHGLGLNEDQKKKLHALFVENLNQRMELQKQVQPQVKAANRETLQEIDAVLTPDQQQHFHENLVLFKERYGRNPFNTGGEAKADAPAAPESVGAGTNTPATNAPADAK
ncbi:MAG TPA: hypothetical protein VGZ93_09525 [Candidatus Methylacidiphilales bacterium]|jgi:hypothetical protein|nr:hypothetical protein [Candidatus Methylacidiphilales bacterium]